MENQENYDAFAGLSAFAKQVWSAASNLEKPTKTLLKGVKGCTGEVKLQAALDALCSRGLMTISGGGEKRPRYSVVTPMTAEEYASHLITEQRKVQRDIVMAMLPTDEHGIVWSDVLTILTKTETETAANTMQ